MSIRDEDEHRGVGDRESERPPSLLARFRSRGRTFSPHRANNLDFIRFVAASLVLYDHSYPLTGRNSPLGPLGFETFGAFAVVVFFLLSGFLVTGSWERSPRAATFARKRALRIVPGYATVNILAAFVLGPLVTYLPVGEYLRNPQTWAYLQNLTFVQVFFTLPGVFTANPYPNAVNGSIWTLPIEVFMYAVLALIGWMGLLERRRLTVIVALLGFVWWQWSTELGAAKPILTVALPLAYTVRLGLWFFIGAAFWVWRDRIRYRSDLAVGILAVLLWWTHRGGAPGPLVYLGFAYVLFWFAQLAVPVLGKFGRFGDFSYGIYLYAFPVQQTVARSSGASWYLGSYMAFCFVITLACAIASWWLVERPAMKRKRAVRAGAREVPARDQRVPPDAHVQAPRLDIGSAGGDGVSTGSAT